MLIVTGTGRCGTKTLAKLLGIHHEYNCAELIRGWFRDYGNTACPWEDKEATLRHHLRNAGDLAHFGDSSNLYVHFLPELLKIDPGVRVIHLVRNPYDFIESALGRGWHGREIFGMAPEPYTFSANVWHTLNEIQKCAWLWVHRNKLVVHEMSKFQCGQFIRIRIERLYEDGTLDALRRFIGRGAEWFALRTREMVSQKAVLNADHRDQVFYWNSTGVRDVLGIASDMMGVLGYDARGLPRCRDL